MPQLGKRQVTLVCALRSKQYQQIKRLLRSFDGHCALGISSDVSGLGEWVYLGNGIYTYHVNGRTIEYEQLMEYYGLTMSGVISLVQLNDAGLRLNWIASDMMSSPEAYFALSI